MLERKKYCVDGTHLSKIGLKNVIMSPAILIIEVQTNNVPKHFHIITKELTLLCDLPLHRTKHII